MTGSSAGVAAVAHRRALRLVDQALDLGARPEVQLGDGAPLVRERRHRDAPALVHRAERAVDGDAHVGEEDLVELLLAGDRLERPHFDAGQRHVDEQARDALVLRHARVGAHEELAPVREVAERVPRLLTVDDPAVAVEHGRGAQRREVGAGVRFGEALAPDVVAAEHAGEERGLLFVGAVLDDRGRDVREAERVERARRVRAVHLLRVHDLFHHARAAPAPFLGPRDRGEARVGQRAVPGAQAVEPLAADLHRTAAEAVADEVGGQVRVEPGAELLAERLGLGRIPKVHGSAAILDVT